MLLGSPAPGSDFPEIGTAVPHCVGSYAPAVVGISSAIARVARDTRCRRPGLSPPGAPAVSIPAQTRDERAALPEGVGAVPNGSTACGTVVFVSCAAVLEALEQVQRVACGRRDAHDERAPFRDRQARVPRP